MRWPTHGKHSGQDHSFFRHIAGLESKPRGLSDFRPFDYSAYRVAPPRFPVKDPSAARPPDSWLSVNFYRKPRTPWSRPYSEEHVGRINGAKNHVHDTSRQQPKTKKPFGFAKPPAPDHPNYSGQKNLWDFVKKPNAQGAAIANTGGEAILSAGMFRYLLQLNGIGEQQIELKMIKQEPLHLVIALELDRGWAQFDITGDPSKIEEYIVAILKIIPIL